MKYTLTILDHNNKTTQVYGEGIVGKGVAKVMLTTKVHTQIRNTVTAGAIRHATLYCHEHGITDKINDLFEQVPNAGAQSGFIKDTIADLDVSIIWEPSL